MKLKTLDEKLSNQGNKKILALDGGGVRGALTLGYLEKIEQLLRDQNNNQKLVLADYYDLIGGTSTGAIIATLLSLGKSVDDIIKIYQTLGKDIFGKRVFNIIPRSWQKPRAFFSESYSSANLEKLMQKEIDDTTLDDTNKIKCGLAINAKRADTYSLWTVANHPDGIYYKANSHLKLWELCRASSAAPYYFKAKKLSLKRRNGDAIEAAFVDGGVSLANNPGFQLFLVATVDSFGFKWKNGDDEMFITSVGTGSGVKKDKLDDLLNSKTISWMPKLPELFMTDASEMNDILFQILGKNQGHSTFIDSQFNDLGNTKLVDKKLFSFVRYNVKLTVKDLSLLNLKDFDTSDAYTNSLNEMDHYENIDRLLEIGRTDAQKITVNDFPDRLIL